MANDILEKRLELLEHLLGEACRSLDVYRHSEIRRRIEEAIPHPDPTMHAGRGDGVTLCGKHLGDFPRPRLARDDAGVDCQSCILNYIADRRAARSNIAEQIDRAQALYDRLRGIDAVRLHEAGARCIVQVDGERLCGAPATPDADGFNRCRQHAKGG